MADSVEPSLYPEVQHFPSASDYQEDQLERRATTDTQLKSSFFDSEDEDEKKDVVPGLNVPRSPKKPAPQQLAFKARPPRKIENLLLRARMQRGGHGDETTPLLSHGVSLPTVVGYDEVVENYPGPSGTTRSESEMTAKEKRLSETSREYNPNKERPFIATPIMPIASQHSVEIVDANRRRRTKEKYGSVVVEDLIPASEGSESSDDDSSEEDDENTGKSGIIETVKYLKAKKMLGTVIWLAIASFCSSLAFSCLAPFFPSEAKAKGLSETQTGIVFGCFELVMFIVSPLAGRSMVRFGVNRMFLIGMVIGGAGAVLFGFLNFVPQAYFFWAAMLLRVVQAFGDAMFATAMYTIIAMSSRSRVGVLSSFLEALSGLGYTVGPAIGGFLYDRGGFSVPFIALGSVILLTALIVSFSLKKSSKLEITSDAKIGVRDFLRIRRLLFCTLAVILCAISMSFIEPTLTPHLEELKLTSSEIGLIFLLSGGFYMLSSLASGVILDRYHNGLVLMFLGAIINVVGMLLLGPSPLLGIAKNLTMVIVSMIILGVASGLMYVPTFQTCIDIAVDNGYPNNMHLYGRISGFTQSMFALGSSIGPSLGGVLVEHVGFAWTSTFIGFALAILSVAMVFLFLPNCFRSRTAPAPVSEALAENEDAV